MKSMESKKPSCKPATPPQESAAMSVETNTTAGISPVLNDNIRGTISRATHESVITTTETTSTVRLISTEHSRNEEDNELNDYIGWEEIGSYYVPYIKRTFNGETFNYVSVKVAEKHPLSKYRIATLVKLYTCPSVKSFFISENEAELLNYINSDKFYEKSQFYGGKDYIVRLEDVKELYTFIEVCFKQLLYNTPSARQRKCGFICIKSTSVVPYCIKDNHKYIPLFCFTGNTDSLSQNAIKLENWDLAYLKFCSKVQGVKNELDFSDSCTVVRLDDIKKYFAPDTNFEEYWPPNIVDIQVFTKKNSRRAPSSWIRVPDSSENPNSISASTLGGPQPSMLIWFNSINQMNTPLINQPNNYTPINNSMGYAIPQPSVQAGIQLVPIAHMNNTPIYNPGNVNPLYSNQVRPIYDVQRFNNGGQVQQQQQMLNQNTPLMHQQGYYIHGPMNNRATGNPSHCTLLHDNRVWHFYNDHNQQNMQ